eukprot:PhF_6_TR25749/c1_g1_i1/m.36295
MKEMEIPIGHRRQIANLLQVMRSTIGAMDRSTTELSTTSEENITPKRMDTVYHFKNLLMSVTQETSKTLGESKSHNMIQSSLTLTCGVKWIDFEGHTNSLDSFFDLVES